MAKQLRLLTVITTAAAIFMMTPSFAAQAEPDRTRQELSRENTALNWAETQAGAWYAWGGTGPYSAGYDCSGLVWAAFRRLGILLPRTTYGMLASSQLRQVPASQARRGDLAFFGSGHVEILTGRWHMTFGAHDTGTRVGWVRWGSWWYPTIFMRVIY